MLLLLRPASRFRSSQSSSRLTNISVSATRLYSATYSPARPQALHITPTSHPAKSFFSKPITTIAKMVQAGDSIPSVGPLMENSPGNKVDLAELLKEGKGLVIGVPAAFSPGCSETHVPDYIKSEKLASAGKVFVVSVNDAFVMKAWGKTLDTDASSGIRFIADPTGAFTEALGVTFDATPVLGNKRSKRYAMVTEDGKVKSIAVEPDNTGIDVSAVGKVLA